MSGTQPMFGLQPMADRSRRLLLGACVLMVALIGFLDLRSGPELAVTVFYLVPLAISTWFDGRLTGSVVGLVATVVHLVIDLQERRYVHMAVPYWNAAASLVFFLIVTACIGYIHQLLRKEQVLAHTDSMTGAANARTFYEVTERELDRTRRHPRPLTVAYLDLDNFKQVNDLYGHLVGDELLRHLTSILLDNTRATDLVARLGGDEFGILFPETDGPGALTALEKVREKLRAECEKNRWPVTCSIGAITYEDPPSDVETLVRKADDLMYEVKHSGKDAVRHRVEAAETADL